ncbi:MULTISPECIES: P27 family phage terminase small subunit [Clostridium]|uniref:P27 family phage terminase small subunit n=1 Tax=Clostridium TaxID=1485 RepID=UPI000824E03B|nr:MULTISPECIES: P27 family phage terminase small subunit [Clostridium]PJI09970.1 hypothetical protein CUB90_19780 [Clostridium sp. CT7]
MGRIKEPINSILARGNVAHKTKAEIKERMEHEVKVGIDDFITPSYIKSKKQKERFDWLKEQLIQAKILSNLDAETLGRYVLLEEQYNKIAKEINKVSPLGKDYSDLLNTQKSIFNMLDRAGNELGLNIMSRCKLTVPKEKEKPKNKFDKFKGSVTK